jgi:sugar phosphate isomerase/epimerase
VRRNSEGQKEYCRLRDGYIDYKPIVEGLERRRYNGFWAVEYEEVGDVFEGTRDDLKSLMDFF